MKVKTDQLLEDERLEAQAQAQQKIEADRRFAAQSSAQQQYAMTGQVPGPTNKGGGNPPTTPTPPTPPTTPTNSNVTSGSYGGSYSPMGGYQESQAVIDARNAMNAHNANPIGAWTGGSYGAALQQALNKIVNREKFSYDLNADALYQQYKDRYVGLGRMAMQDTMGQAAAMTGGYGNSYAQTAGNQSYQGYLQGLNDKVPELYQLALDKYNNEGQELLNQYNMYQNAYDTEYGQYRDRVNDWYNEANRLQNAYYNAYNQDYGLYSDNYSRAMQAAQASARSSGGSSSGSSSSSRAYVPEGHEAYIMQGVDNAIANYNKGNMDYASLRAFMKSGGLSDGEIDSYLYQYGINGDFASSGSGSASTGNSSGNASTGKVNQNAINSFKNALQSTTSFYNDLNHVMPIGGGAVRFNDYEDYVDAMINNWHANGKLSDEDVKELFKQYGIV